MNHFPNAKLNCHSSLSHTSTLHSLTPPLLTPSHLHSLKPVLFTPHTCNPLAFTRALPHPPPYLVSHTSPDLCIVIIAHLTHLHSSLPHTPTPHPTHLYSSPHTPTLLHSSTPHSYLYSSPHTPALLHSSLPSVLLTPHICTPHPTHLHSLTPPPSPLRLASGSLVVAELVPLVCSEEASPPLAAGGSMDPSLH